MASARAELREKGSRFVAEVVPVADEAAARRSMAEVVQRHSGATHHCWAWRLGWPARERSADAGEPSGTAGAPILRALQAAGVSDALVVVTRWFGGVKLGRGGLARAYGGAAAACLVEATLAERRPSVVRLLTLPYERTGGVKRLLAAPGVAVVRRDYAERVTIEVVVEVAALPDFEASVAELGPDVELSRINRGATP